MSKKNKHLENCTSDKKCSCNEECSCDDNCNCDKENNCNESCHCNEQIFDKEECSCQDCAGDDCLSEESRTEADKYLELAKRVQAEFDNYRKRTKEAESQARQNGIIFAVEKILPVVDSVDNAKKQVEDEDFKKALDLVNTQIIQSLESLGIKRIEALGKEFNPNYHNAILTGSNSEKLDDEILEEYQAGFILNDKVIRHSVVKVNKL